jgi:hypothetical protein
MELARATGTERATDTGVTLRQTRLSSVAACATGTEQATDAARVARQTRTLRVRRSTESSEESPACDRCGLEYVDLQRLVEFSSTLHATDAPGGCNGHVCLPRKLQNLLPTASFDLWLINRPPNQPFKKGGS